jgi:phosphatidylserine decarboxylase
MTSGLGVWLFQHLLPKNAISAGAYRLARSRRAWIARPLTRWFASAYGVDLDEAEHADVDRYPTFNDFFTRALRPGARPLAGDGDTVASPADGTLSEHGTIEDGTLLQAKGRRYSLDELLGEDGAATDALRGGSYCTIYLAPWNYHRVHAPLDATLVRTRYIPGRRCGVSLATAAAIDRLFCRNERVVCWFETAAGPMVVVLVGALNVSSVSTFNRGEIASGAPRTWVEDARPTVARGAEIGRFNLGSTVVVAFPPGAVRWSERLATGAEVAMGSELGRVERAARSRSGMAPDGPRASRR